ncbi:hypothetical protein DPMN_090774 [Dreissena polymorpha]|uniref:Uncharacterized protein n=1 Tax=Dreissena polymorpha TaxID=45954 RepID=A0A9D4QZB6_DREPO|nr:hypothetical protein DPMN_090774 [Dreissena polymorpha]
MSLYQGIKRLLVQRAGARQEGQITYQASQRPVWNEAATQHHVMRYGTLCTSRVG